MITFARKVSVGLAVDFLENQGARINVAQIIRILNMIMIVNVIRKTILMLLLWNFKSMYEIDTYLEKEREKERERERERERDEMR